MNTDTESSDKILKTLERIEQHCKRTADASERIAAARKRKQKRPLSEIIAEATWEAAEDLIPE